MIIVKKYMCSCMQTGKQLSTVHCNYSCANMILSFPWSTMVICNTRPNVSINLPIKSRDKDRAARHRYWGNQFQSARSLSYPPSPIMAVFIFSFFIFSFHMLISHFCLKLFLSWSGNPTNSWVLFSFLMLRYPSTIHPVTQRGSKTVWLWHCN